MTYPKTPSHTLQTAALRAAGAAIAIAASTAAAEPSSTSRIDRETRADAAITFAGKVYRDPTPVPLVDRCAPTGPEKCLDGIDNDCNGRYDDAGCGYESGLLQWTLSWPGSADLDLHVTGPDGVDVSGDHSRSVATGLVLDRACPGNGCTKGNIENIRIPSQGTARTGTYIAWAEVRNARGSNDPIAARLSGRIGARTWYQDIQLSPMEGTQYRVSYPLGSDVDRDGVEDSQDSCPAARGCYSDTRAYRGCPDDDRDGIPDSVDACPHKPGLTTADAETSGCPVEIGDAWVTNLGIVITKTVEFDTGKATIRPESAKLLADVARAIRARPDAAERLAVDGHTDDVGDDKDNLTLSRGRAEAVSLRLTENGVPSATIAPRGFGETKPTAFNFDRLGRQKNRRVEFVVLRPRTILPECW